MGLCGAHKLVLLIVITAYVFSGTAEAWSWSWGSDQSGSNWGWGWGSDGDNSGGSSSGSKSGGSSWGWGWSSDGTDTNWGWGSSSGSSGGGSTHHNHTASSNHSSSVGSTSHDHTAPSNHSSSAGSTISNNHQNHTAPSNQSRTGGSTSNSHHNHTVQISPRRKIVITVWKKGFDYQAWVSKHAPFYVNDVVVFKYNNDKTQFKMKKHNDVYLLPDLKSYKRCDENRGKKLAARRESSSSGREGFKLLLRKTQPYYFVSGDHSECNHDMKFSLTPILHPSMH